MYQLGAIRDELRGGLNPFQMAYRDGCASKPKRANLVTPRRLKQALMLTSRESCRCRAGLSRARRWRWRPRRFLRAACARSGPSPTHVRP
jgi:hypothetical protein